MSGAAAGALGGLSELRFDWSRLAERSGNLFATWEWNDCWWRHFGRSRPLALAGVRGGDGGLRAILPLYVCTRSPVRMLRFVGHGLADELGPVCDPADVPAARSALEEALGADDRLDLFVADDVDAGAGLEQLPSAARLCRTATPVVSIAGRDFDELLAERSRNFRQQVRARLRRIERGRRVAFRLAGDPARLDADMDTLIGLHRRRWGAGSTVYAGSRRGFHRDFARRALERGWLRLWVLELDGRPAAALQGFRFGGSEWYYQAGRDPAYERDSVGFVLLAHAIREAAADGAAEYRLLRGAEPFKSRFADADATVQTVAVARTRAGRALLAAMRRAATLPAAARRRLPGALRTCSAGSEPLDDG